MAANVHQLSAVLDFLFVCPELLLNDVAVVEINYLSRKLDVEPEQKVGDAQLLMLRWVSQHSRKPNPMFTIE